MAVVPKINQADSPGKNVDRSTHRNLAHGPAVLCWHRRRAEVGISRQAHADLKTAGGHQRRRAPRSPTGTEVMTVIGPSPIRSAAGNAMRRRTLPIPTRSGICVDPAAYSPAQVDRDAVGRSFI